MRKEPTKPWKDDRQLEQELIGTHEPVIQGTKILLELQSGKKIKLDLVELVQFVEQLYAKVNKISSECISCNSSISSLEKEFRAFKNLNSGIVKQKLSIEERKERSAKRALDLQKKLGIQGDLSKIDGFASLVGMFKPYSRPNESSVEFLESAREE